MTGATENRQIAVKMFDLHFKRLEFKDFETRREVEKKANGSTKLIRLDKRFILKIEKGIRTSVRPLTKFHYGELKFEFLFRDWGFAPPLIVF